MPIAKQIASPFGFVQSVPIAAFNPGDMSSLYSWYDPSDLSTITEVAGAVSQLDDKGPNGKDITQGSGSSQPTTGTQTINGLNVLNYDGGDSLRNSAYDLTLLDTDVLISAVFDADNTVVKRICGWSVVTTAQHMDAQGYGNFFGSVWVLTGVALSAVPHLQTSRVADASSELWQDTISADTAAYASQANVTPAFFDVGQSGGSAFLGKIAEIVLYTDASERVELETYLKAKWGTP